MVTLVKFFILCVVFNISVALNYGEQSMVETIKEWRNNLNQRTNKNEKCDQQLTEWLDLLEQRPIMQNNWAWRMLDASNKINPGILTGNVMGIGNFDECLNINEMHKQTIEIKGKYCFPIPIPLNSNVNSKKFEVMNMFQNRESQIAMPDYYMLALCIPHECSLMDLIQSQRENQIDDMCQTKDQLKIFTGRDWAFIGFIILIAFLVVVSTINDWYCRKTKKTPHPITLAFSFYTNGEKLVRISNNPEQIKCLDGLRTLSMFWVMMGHRFSGIAYGPLLNLEDAVEWSNSKYSQYIQAAPLAVDSFFFLTGVLIAYGFMKTQCKPKARFNILLYYIHRYIRLTPAVAVLFFFCLTVFRHISSGPMWPGIFKFLVDDTCLEYPYAYFLYIQNIVNPNEMCLLHTWYLSVDFQIFLFSPIILLPLVKWPKYAGYALVGLILLSVLPPTLITYFMDILQNDINYNKHYYFQPYNRISPWLIGVLLGHLFFHLKDKKIKINWKINLCIWCVVLIGMFLIIYFGSEMIVTTDVAKYAIYNGTHRMFWAVGLMWIVFACKYGYGGIINWFLSIPIFQVWGRLSYSMYLIHIILQMTSTFRKRTAINFDDYEIMSIFFSDIVTVTFVSFFYCLLFESPMVTIEKLAFAPNGWISSFSNFFTKSANTKRMEDVK